MHFIDNIIDNKYKILEDIFANDKLMRLLVNQGTDCLDIPITIDPKTLMYEQIFPYDMVVGTETVKNNYITFTFERFRPTENGGQSFATGFIRFDVICHKTLVGTNYNALRYDLILKELYEMFLNNREYSIGKLDFVEMGYDETKSRGTEFNVNYIVFKPVDFQ